VPKHWEVKKVSYACEIHNNLRTPIDRNIRAQKSGPYPYYGPTGILDYIDEFYAEGEYFLIGEDGDHFLKFNEKSMTVRVNGKFCVNNHAHLLRGKGNCSTDWAALCFEKRDLSPWLIKQGVARYKLRKEILANILIAVPPSSEATKIARFIDRETDPYRHLDRRAAAADRTAQRKASGGDFPCRHQGPRPHRPHERFRRRVARPSTQPLGGNKAETCCFSIWR